MPPAQPRLVYGRITGYGRDGPNAVRAGHDINYISLAGALDPIGRAGQGPAVPLNLVGDFGGGGMLLAFGVVAALLETSRSGVGQVVDAAMVDGAALLMTMMHGMRAMGRWHDERGTNLLDSGAPFYDVYETADGKYVSVGALEPQFYHELLQRTGADAAALGPQADEANWPAARQQLAGLFRTKTREQWCQLLERTDACFAPVLSMSEAPSHPHNRYRRTFVEFRGTLQPAPAPRFSRTAGAIRRPPPRPAEHTDEILAELGIGAAQASALRASGAVA